MNKAISHSLALVLSIILSGVAYSEPYKKIPLIQITQGYETDVIQLDRGLDGKIKGIETSQCASCPVEQYGVTDQTIFYLGAEEISLEMVTALNGKSGTIAYYPKTKELHHIRFFNLED